MNERVSKWMVEEVGRLQGRPAPDPGQSIAVMLGRPGYGKTHLFGRVGHQAGSGMFFVFVPQFEGRKPIEHVCWHVVEALFEPGIDGHSPLQVALGGLCRPAFAEYFADLPPTQLARHESIRRRLEDSDAAALEIVAGVGRLEPFLKLADSLVPLLPSDSAITRALALGWAPPPWSSNARRWLQGQSLPEADLEALGLGEEPPAPLDVLRAVGPLFRHQRPLMICLDQIESILKGDDSEALNRFTTNLMEILQAIPSQIVVSCYIDQWEKLKKNSFGGFLTRVRQPVFQLDDMTGEQALGLVNARLASWSGRRADRPPLWPFDAPSIAQWVRDEQPTPRALIQRCGDRLESWAEEGIDEAINIGAEAGIGPDLPYLFLQEWNREIEAIRRDPKRSAEYLAEERCYRGIFEALKIAESARRERDFGGVRIVQVADRAVKDTPASPRPAARCVLSAGPGKPSPAVVVALTKLDNAQRFNAYFRALLEAAGDPATGILLIHPRRDLTLGRGAARKTYEVAIDRGRLRSLPLEDHPQTQQAAECLAALLDRASDRTFVLSGQTLSEEDCRDLVVKTGVIDNLDLFKMLGSWRKTPTPAPVLAAAAIPATEGRPVAPASTPATAPTAGGPPGPSTPPGPADSAANGTDMDLGAWAGKKLAAAVKKLGLLNLDVEPSGFEVGPTFVRLRVNPVKKTNFRAVSNKAVDLRISLGLDAVPIVGSQAGCISIDVQRPDRALVSLAEALADRPEALGGMPAFPVGADVAGRAHWLNLADPSDCHLLVAGTTGSGKSEFLRAMIAALAAGLGPEQLQFVLIDPKRVTFNLRGASPYLRDAVAHSLDEALPLVERCMAETDRRYKLLEERKLANVSDLPPDMLPRIVLIIDEFANFLEDKQSKKVMTALLKKIGSMSRAAGIHLILATQRPDRDVITPILRENLPGRIALRVSSKAGSDLILGSPEAEHLLGKGDLFWKKGGELLRLQCPYVTQAELESRLRIAE